MLIRNEYPWIDHDLSSLLAMRAALPHALLIHGPSGIGKSALAEVFASALLCEQPSISGAACGGCPACGWQAQDNHPDIRRLAPVSEEEGGESREKPSREIKIGQIRALAGFLSVGAHRGGRKIVLVDPADAMNTPAANALLKTLEDPPGDTVFLLVASRADALPATIRSRCVAMPVRMPALALAREWLSRLASAGGTSDPAWGVDAWLAAAGGAPLRALELSEPAEAAAHRDAVATFASIPDASPLAAAEALSRSAPRDWLPVLQGWVCDLGRVVAGARPRRYPSQGSRLLALARSAHPATLVDFESWLRLQRPLTEHPLNARLFCEDAVLRYARVFRGAPNPDR